MRDGRRAFGRIGDGRSATSPEKLVLDDILASNKQVRSTRSRTPGRRSLRPGPRPAAVGPGGRGRPSARALARTRTRRTRHVRPGSFPYREAEAKPGAATAFAQIGFGSTGSGISRAVSMADGHALDGPARCQHASAWRPPSAWASPGYAPPPVRRTSFVIRSRTGDMKACAFFSGRVARRRDGPGLRGCG